MTVRFKALNGVDEHQSLRFDFAEVMNMRVLYRQSFYEYISAQSPNFKLFFLRLGTELASCFDLTQFLSLN